MDDTLFYVLGIGLVVVAVLVAAIGLRFDKFQLPRGARAGHGRVRGTSWPCGRCAWPNAEDEQEHREAEARGRPRRPRRGRGRRGGRGGRPGRGPDSARPPPPRAQSSTRPTVAAAVHAGRGGLDRDDGPRPRRRARGQGRGLHRGVDRRSERRGREGLHPPDVMPQTFGNSLSQEEIDALVQYLIESTSGQS